LSGVSSCVRRDRPVRLGSLSLTVYNRENFLWTVTPQYRSDDDESILHRLSGRVSTSANLKIYKGMHVFGGIDVIWRQRVSEIIESGGDWEEDYHGGVSYPLPVPKFAVNRRITGASVYEYDNRVRPLSNRHLYHQRIVFEAFDLKHAPWFYNQFTFYSDQGFGKYRGRLGWTFNINQKLRLQAGCQFQSVKTRRVLNSQKYWQPQHAIWVSGWIGYRPPMLWELGKGKKK
jgi:hypothetical protein